VPFSFDSDEPSERPDVSTRDASGRPVSQRVTDTEASTPASPTPSPAAQESEADTSPTPPPPRLVGRLVDPSVEGEEDGWTGADASHPERDRLLARAAAAQDSPTGEDAWSGASSSHPVRDRLLARAAAAQDSPAGEDAWSGAGSSHPVRDRLLARATAARSGHAPETTTASTWPNTDVPTAPAGPVVPRTPIAPGSMRPAALDELAHGEPGAPRSPLDSELDRVALGDTDGAGPLDVDALASASRRPGLSPHLVALFSTLLGLTTVGSLVALASHFDTNELPRPIAQTEASEEAVEGEETAASPADARPTREKIPGPWRVADDADKPGMRLISGKIGTKAFLTAIQDAGLEKSQAYRAYTALKDLTNLDRCRSSDEFVALVERGSGKLIAFEYSPSKEEVFQAATGDDGYLKGKKLDLHVARNQVRRALRYDGKSLNQSAVAAGFDPGIDGVLAKALSGHMTLSELEAGDRLRLILQEVTVLGEFSRYAGVEAVEVVRGNDKPLRIYYYNHPTEGGYFDGTGRAPYEGGWRKPIPGAPVTSKFNMTRMHPVLKRVVPHTGTDFGAPIGVPIGASAPGRVSFIGYAGPSGNLVKVEHPGGYETGYAHLSRFAEGLKVGDQVKRMQVVGYCGSTGRSTGPHLHFTVKKDGKFIDPESLNLDGMRVLPPSHRETFGEVKRKYDELLDAIPLPEVTASAPAAPDAGDPARDEPDVEGDDELPGGSAPPAAAPAATAATPAAATATTTASAPAGKPAQPAGNAAIFLTDGELLRMQGLTDDGEVD